MLVVTRQDVHARPHLFLRSLLEVLLAHGRRAADHRLLSVQRHLRRIAAQSRFHTTTSEVGT